MLQKLKRYLKDPRFALGCDLLSRHPRWMSDRFWIETNYRLVFGKKLNLKEPKTFNEKLQWLKLYDRNPIYTNLVDKIAVKAWAAGKIGEEFIIPTIKVFDSVDDIRLDELPPSFVLKCNHDSGSAIICQNKQKFDLDAAKKRLGVNLRTNFYFEAREWPYKNVKPRIFAEEFIGPNLQDYKFFTFDGKVRSLYVTTHMKNRIEDFCIDYFDPDFKHLDVSRFDHPNSDVVPAKPKRFEDMKMLAEKLGKGFPHVRVDFYESSGRVFWGEMTFSTAGGFRPLSPSDFDLELGGWLNLPPERRRF